MFCFLGIFFIVLFVIVMVVVVWLQFFYFEQIYLFVQFVVVWGIVFGGFFVVVVVVLLLLFVRFLCGFVVFVLIVVLFGVVVIVVIGVVCGFGVFVFLDVMDISVWVFIWNIVGEVVMVERIVQEIFDQGVDIVVFLEIIEVVGECIVIMFCEQGYLMWVYYVQFCLDVQDGLQLWQMMVLVVLDLGEYLVIEFLKDGLNNIGLVLSVVLMLVDGLGLIIVVVYVVVLCMEEMQQWQSDLQWIVDQCLQGDFIFVGDFNVMVDYMVLLGVDGGDIGYCWDVVLWIGNGFVGIWLSLFFLLVGVFIDYVMVFGNWILIGFVVFDDVGGSDYCVLVVQFEFVC